MNRTLALAAIVLGLCSCDASIFYVEASESRLCKEVDGIGPFPASPIPSSTTVSNDFSIPVGSAIPIFDPSQGSLELSLLDLTMTKGTGLTSFDGFESASMTLIPPEDSGLDPKVVLQYTASGTAPDTLSLQGDPTLNLFPYMQGSGDVAVHAEITGTFPNNEWSVNVDPCLSMKVRLNYANLLLGDGGIPH